MNERVRCTKVCPACGSTNISLYATDAGVWDFCNDCGFGRDMSVLGGSFPEVEVSMLDEFRAELRKSKRRI